MLQTEDSPHNLNVPLGRVQPDLIARGILLAFALFCKTGRISLYIISKIAYYGSLSIGSKWRKFYMTMRVQKPVIQFGLANELDSMRLSDRSDSYQKSYYWHPIVKVAMVKSMFKSIAKCHEVAPSS